LSDKMCTFVHRYLGFVVKTKVTKKGRIPSEETDLNFRDVKKFSGHQYYKLHYKSAALSQSDYKLHYKNAALSQSDYKLHYKNAALPPSLIASHSSLIVPFPLSLIAHR
ncbi:MAG: hypothetical protein IIV71_06400, partial [Bacteroidaceae bacterium]|nr:hypothetical protein [Bacteroidaceae bacterium]